MIPPVRPHTDLWTRGSVVGWWDVSLMLIFGGIPWNCYFQRVLSCRTPRDAKRQSILAGVLTIAFTVPPLLMGIAAFAYPWPADIVSRLQATPADAMPLLFARAVPPRNRPSRPCGDHRRRDVQLQLVDPLRGVDAQLELPEAPRLAFAVGRPDEARHPIVDPAVRRAGHRARAEGPERPGAVVLHQRPRLRPAVPAAAVRAVRSEGQPHRIDRGVRRVVGAAGSAAASRCSACRRSFAIRRRCRSERWRPLSDSCCCRSSVGPRRDGMRRCRCGTPARAIRWSATG